MQSRSFFGLNILSDFNSFLSMKVKAQEEKNKRPAAQSEKEDEK